MSQARADQQRNHSNSQIIAALYSIIFVSLIAFGYYLLFSKNALVAAALGIVLALIAWFIARFVGNHENGIRRYWPMFGMLLVISAVGVFNSLMLNLEGRRIFTETIDNSVDRFTALDAAASKRMAEKGIGQHLEKVRQLEDALIREIENPLNCGQGPVAQKIIQDLKRELPGFTPLSSTGVDCSKNDEIVADYKSRIADLVKGAAWNDATLLDVRTQAMDANSKLQDLSTRSATMFAPGLLTKISPELTQLDVKFRANRDRLARQDVDVSSLPKQLHLSEVNNLGEWSQLPNLIIERMDRITTWLYLFLAFCFDWLMVYLFNTVRLSRPTRSGQPVASSGGMQKAW